MSFLLLGMKQKTSFNHVYVRCLASQQQGKKRFLLFYFEMYCLLVFFSPVVSNASKGVPVSPQLLIISCYEVTKE